MYSAYQREKADRGETSIVYALTLRKAAFVLADYLSSGIIDWKRRNYDERRLPNGYQEIFNGFASSISGGLAPGSVELITQMVRRFLFFLEDSGYHDVCDLTDTAPIRDFIIREAPKHSGNRVNLTWPIKKFMRFLLDTGKVSFDVSPMFMNPVPNRKKVLPCFEDEELNALFGAVDTSSAIGKIRAIKSITGDLTSPPFRISSKILFANLLSFSKLRLNDESLFFSAITC